MLISLQDDQAAGITGTPRREIRNGRAYWYEMFRIGSDVRKRYIGEDTPEVAARIARHRELAEQGKARAEDRTRLIRILRAEGAQPIDPATGSILSALAQALEDGVETPLAETFRRLDFEPAPSLDSRTVWRWRQTRSNTMVEFLTPSFRPEEDIRDLPALGVSAQ